MNPRQARVPLAILLAASRLHAQALTVPAHPLGKRVATSTVPLKSITSVRPLNDGHVVVQDGAGRRVLLFDSTLTSYVVLIDSGGGAVRNYGPESRAPLIPYLADTTLFFDVGSGSLVVIDPTGKIARVMSVPNPADAAFFAGFTNSQIPAGLPRVDPLGRLIYRATTSADARPMLAGNGGMMMTGAMAGAMDRDSSPIVRAGRSGASPDTLGHVRLFKQPGSISLVTARGTRVQAGVTNPIMVADDWVVTSDGWLALVRGQDYHIDWVAPDGSRSSSSKLPFLWHRLSDGEKVAIVDSVRAFNVAHARVFTAGGRGAPGPPDTITIANGVISADSLADYQAPFSPGTSLADADGNLWLRPTPSVPLATGPGAVYDIVNRRGVLIDRVQVPPTWLVIGFAPGVVYMTSREGSGTVLLAARVR